MSEPHQLLHSSDRQDWCTPPHVINLARLVMGEIDLDPASSEQANEHVKARFYHSAEHDGLSVDWFGRVWCNPPYGKVGGQSGAGLWGAKMIDQWRQHAISQGMLLVNASIGDAWFNQFWDFPVLLFHKRLRFSLPDGTQGGSPTKGNALIYFGPYARWALFRRLGSLHGRVVLP